MRRRPHKKSRSTFKIKLLVVLVFLLGLFLIIQARIRPILVDMATNQSQIVVNQAVNEAIMEVLNEQQISYDSLIHLTTDSQDNVTSIETNIVQMNRLKASISQSVQDKLVNLDKPVIDIPLGSLLGDNLLSGFGPNLHARLQMSGSIVPQVESEFSDAGINQVLHQLVLKMNTQFVVIMAGQNIIIDVPSEFVIAESIIVGEVPQAYTQVTGGDDSSIAKMNDYRADRYLDNQISNEE
ncbi:sporulation protein YunB [Solibaculum mannosilyticum]|uniref:Sporulation protein YunB n=1 Tax=Solibaculum mannosilyticum TaxID=2780922 RepID=A0A7I8D317_9FIRM|nr:sporulation protein YunB [Solibaculum mannosilyticum]BCI60385.1 sporulation protein YunB [Solibaculum mannosilyticum]